jgi:hypothetical protein
MQQQRESEESMTFPVTGLEGLVYRKPAQLHQQPLGKISANTVVHALKIEAICSSETPVHSKDIPLRYIAEVTTLLQKSLCTICNLTIQR